MNFSTDFFRDEVRCGFYIPTAVKQAWAAELEVLAEIDEICTKHGIKYFADWGTILGAVRHGGFVPWDDDLDICMLRDDYVRFRQVADAELPKEYVIHDYERQEDHWLFLARVVNNKKICFEPEYLNAHNNFPYLAGVDIFVKDYLYKDHDKEKERDDEIMHILAVADGIVAGSLKQESTYIWLKKFKEQYGFSLDPSLDARHKGIELYRLAEKQMSRVSAEETDTIGQIFPMILKGQPGQAKAYYDEIVRLPFENTTIPVPASYDTILRSRYGDYLTIRKVWTGHDYPFFEGQRADMQAKADFEFPEYKFDRRVFEEWKEGKRVSDPDPDRVLFLCAGPLWWKAYEPFYEKECAAGKEVYVVALPLLFKDCYGNINASDEELAMAAKEDEYPPELTLTPWYEIEISELKPGRIYIQDVYDEENPCMSIPPVFYSSELRQYTGELICVPALHGDDFKPEDRNDVYNLKHRALKPGIVYADKVLLATETLRQRYLEKLLEWAGEDTREYWEDKLDLKEEEHKESAVENSDTDEACEEAKTSDSSQDSPPRKKRVLFVVGANEVAEYHEKAVELLKKKMEVFAENAEKIEVNICLYPPMIEEWEEALDGNAQVFIDELEKSMEQEAVGFCDLASATEEELVDYHDAYYGSASPLVHEFVRAKKPVMIADYSVGE